MDNGLVRRYLDLPNFGGDVLILVVVDNGLVLEDQLKELNKIRKDVLILVVVDNGLVLDLIRYY